VGRVSGEREQIDTMRDAREKLAGQMTEDTGREHHVAKVPDRDPSWRLQPAERHERRCRYAIGSVGNVRVYCRRPAVVELNRGRYAPGTRGTRRDAWWAYCGDHLYGRWMEDGVLMCWGVVDAGGRTVVPNYSARGVPGSG
jgi:hypothetical protein